jgi:murein DD-endopeptidase MepM/ murein hydrolase activator NlpD
MKINSKKIFSSIIIFVMTVMSVLSFPNQILADNQTTPSSSGSSAVTNPTTNSMILELQNQINDRTQKIQALNDEIAKYQNLASQANNQSQTLKSTIASLDNDKKKLNLEIEKINLQIDDVNANIGKLKDNISESEDKINWMNAALAKGLREIYQSDDTHLSLLLLNNISLSSFFGQIENQKDLNKSINQTIAQIALEKQNLEKNKANVEKTQQDLSDLKSQLGDKTKIVDDTKTEQQKILADTKNQEKNYQAMVAARIAQKNAFEKDIFDYESKIKFTLDPNSIPKEGSSALFWPLDHVIVTQKFGKTVAAKRLYVSGSHNGLDLGASVGTPVKAANAGIVVGTGDTDKDCRRVSFGRWIYIRHNNGLGTIYGHLSAIDVTAGQVVTAGQLIGYSGFTGYATGPHLHLGVYVDKAVTIMTRPSVSCPGHSMTMPVAPIDAYLDPMLYLPPVPSY